MKVQKYNLIARSRSHYYSLDSQTVYSCQKEETMTKHCAKMMFNHGTTPERAKELMYSWFSCCGEQYKVVTFF